VKQIKDLITHGNKHLLFKDELGDTFLLTDYCEIYLYSDEEIKVLSWKPASSISDIMEKAEARDYFRTDDGLNVYMCSIDKLNYLIGKNKRQRRLSVGCKKAIDLEERLGHKIRAYNPPLEKELTSYCKHCMLKRHCPMGKTWREQNAQEIVECSKYKAKTNLGKYAKKRKK